MTFVNERFVSLNLGGKMFVRSLDVWELEREGTHGCVV